VLRIKPRTLHLLSLCSTTEQHRCTWENSPS
jgi:hypothetical protein